jgi:N-alpha-acetyltransferase 15/16, NatA auxiliary subunit
MEIVIAYFDRARQKFDPSLKIGSEKLQIERLGMMAGEKEVLAPKEQATFRQILRNYEGKQHKKGLKACEAILKKHPAHGETLSMKGLILNSMGPTRKAEAYELCKKGLRHDLTSHICWHVLGMVYRADRNYEEALKCYQNAIKFDKDNLNILKDMAVLQIQCRLYEPYAETRLRLLQLKPQIRQNWTALAVGHHLQGDPARAVQILSAFEETLKVSLTSIALTTGPSTAERC